MNNIIETFLLTFNILKLNVPIVLGMLAVLWGIQLLNWSIGYRLNIFGIYPRHPIGLIGIFISPFLHGNFNHLFFNSIPFFILASFVLLGGLQQFLIISGIIIVLSGLGIWLFGRRSLHIGASSLIMGYLGYCLITAYHNVNVISVGIGLVCLYYFGSFLFSIFPTEERVSWEGHFFGLIAGVIASYAYPYVTFYLS